MNNKLIDDKTSEIIVKMVANYYDLTPEEVFSKTRKRKIAVTRQIIHFLIKENTKKSLEAIGEISLIYGRKKPHDHATVLHSVNIVNNFLDTDKTFLFDFKRLELKVKSALNSITPEDINEIKMLDTIDKYDELLYKKELRIIELLEVIRTLKGNSKNKHIKQLLIMDDRVINMFAETRLKPFLRMLKSKVTNADLIARQIETRNN